MSYSNFDIINDPLYNENGYLTTIIGPMFSGKTTKLINMHNYIKTCSPKGWNYKQRKKENNKLIPTILVINYKLDTRYSNFSLSSHDKVMIPCIFIENLSEVADIVDMNIEEINNDFIDIDYILINEAQFFNDIVEWVNVAINKYNKNVIICGLDGDFERKPFGNWLNLIPQSDNVIKLYSNCKYCNNNAIFTHRITNEKQQTVIGSDNYIPLCRKCYNENN